MPNATGSGETKSVILPRRRLSNSAIIAIGLGLCTFALYWPVHGFDFINYDDPDYVSRNMHVQGGLTWPAVRWASTTGFTGNWHPVTWLSHMLDCQLYGLKPGGHHLTNVLLH